LFVETMLRRQPCILGLPTQRRVSLLLILWDLISQSHEGVACNGYNILTWLGRRPNCLVLFKTIYERHGV